MLSFGVNIVNLFTHHPSIWKFPKKSGINGEAGEK
jgi:hypothetical protein